MHDTCKTLPRAICDKLPMLKKPSTQNTQRTGTTNKERNGKVITEERGKRALLSLAKQSLRENMHILNKHTAKW